jgi:hydrogenase maturation protease
VNAPAVPPLQHDFVCHNSRRAVDREHPLGVPLVRKRMSTTAKERILVLGVGNLLMGDEGVGIHAARELIERTLPPHVDVIDGGTAGLDLLHVMEGYERVLIIDAVDVGEEPGAILRFSPQDVTSEDGDFPMSLHQTEILKVLEFAAYVGQTLPPVVMYGVQPETIEWSLELSPRVKARLASLVAAVEEEISTWGM